MSPLNLDDIEEYLVDQAKEMQSCPTRDYILSWVRRRFHELRLREAAVLGGPGRHLDSTDHAD